MLKSIAPAIALAAAALGACSQEPQSGDAMAPAAQDGAMEPMKDDAMSGDAMGASDAMKGEAMGAEPMSGGAPAADGAEQGQ